MAESSEPSAHSEQANPFSRTSHVYQFGKAEDDSVRKQLADDAAWAAALIEKVVSIGGDDAMKPGVCAACEGLGFVRVHKGALGLTYARGHGFVIRKLDQDRYGNMRWSGPVFFHVSQLGLGVSLGYESVESCMALMSSLAVMRFTHDKAVVGTDLGLMTTEGAMSGVPAGTFGRTSHMDVQADNANTVFTYSLSHGLLANLSINGTDTYPDKELNEKLYGSTPLEDVLYGKVNTFEELLPLYRKITDTAKKALE